MISSSSVSPGIVPFPPERDDGGQIRWVWYPVYQAFQSQSWSNSSISMGFDYLLQTVTMLRYHVTLSIIHIDEKNSRDMISDQRFLTSMISGPILTQFMTKMLHN